MTIESLLVTKKRLISKIL